MSPPYAGRGAGLGEHSPARPAMRSSSPRPPTQYAEALNPDTTLFAGRPKSLEGTGVQKSASCKFSSFPGAKAATRLLRPYAPPPSPGSSHSALLAGVNVPRAPAGPRCSEAATPGDPQAVRDGSTLSERVFLPATVVGVPRPPSCVLSVVSDECGGSPPRRLRPNRPAPGSVAVPILALESNAPGRSNTRTGNFLLVPNYGCGFSSLGFRESLFLFVFFNFPCVSPCI